MVILNFGALWNSFGNSIHNIFLLLLSGWQNVQSMGGGKAFIVGFLVCLVVWKITFFIIRVTFRIVFVVLVIAMLLAITGSFSSNSRNKEFPRVLREAGEESKPWLDPGISKHLHEQRY